MSDKTVQGRWNLSRRTFLKATGAVGAAGALAGAGAGLLRKAEVSAQDAAGGDVQRIATFCAMCGPSAGCGIYALVKDGQFIGVEGMPESPTNQGKNCPKAFAAPQWVYSPQRLRYPLKRVGEKGEGKFEQITWDEAITLIADKLKEQKAQYGPESLACLSPARRSYSEYLFRFLISHGSPNYGHSGICAMQKAFALSYTLGTSGANADYRNADLIVIWAKQPVYSGAAKGGVKSIVDAKARGAKLIAIKPSIEGDSAMADVWVPVRPGTDAALALGMLNVVINEKLYDADFVSKYCYGFKELKEHVQQYTAEWAEEICGVPAEQIRAVAREYATTPKAAIDIGNGFEHAPACNDAVRAVASLIAITGHLDKPGTNVVSTGNNMPRRNSVHLKERYTQEWVDKIVAPEFPKPWIEGTSAAYYRLFDSVLTEDPYPIRAIIAPGSQPSVSTRGTKRVLEALEKLEFFVVLDVTRTADMDYADVVVPVATMYEVDHPFESSGNWIMARNKVIEPLGQYKSDYEFWLDLGVAMGYGEDWWNGDITACMDYQLENFEMTMEELRANYPTGIIYQGNPMAYEKYDKIFGGKTTRLDGAPYLPEGKVALYNTTFEGFGYNPLPEWRELPEGPTATPELLDQYPLLMSDYHTSKMYNASWLRNVPYLREIMTYPMLHIHPDTAKERGIKDGDWVIVEGPHGWLKLKAEHYPGIRPDTVMVLHGWWQGCEELGLEDMPLADGGANSNNMYSVEEKAFDPLATAMSSQTLVQVRKA
jgi:anaerobic selenocysteine-containing dehydrogenase